MKGCENNVYMSKNRLKMRFLNSLTAIGTVQVIDELCMYFLFLYLSSPVLNMTMLPFYPLSSCFTTKSWPHLTGWILLIVEEFMVLANLQLTFIQVPTCVVFSISYIRHH